MITGKMMDGKGDFLKLFLIFYFPFTGFRVNLIANKKLDKKGTLFLKLNFDIFVLIFWNWDVYGCLKNVGKGRS